MTQPNFVNRTLWTGDNLDILRGLNSATVDLIYLDPPFNSNKTYEAPVGSKAAGAAFKDSWTLSDLDVAWMGLIADEQPALANILKASGLSHGKGMQSYLTMMAVRLLEMHRVLKPTGSIYLHCDPYTSHYLKMLMDSVFGKANFLNEIVWCYGSGGASRLRYSRKHDIILFYTKSGGRGHVFNVDTVREPYSSPRKSMTPKVIGDKAYQKMHPLGRIPFDWWQIPILTNSDKERTGFPTQKPLALLERIILASSNEDDVVLDPFAGCATACVAAERLGRQWVGIDLSSKAVELVEHRLKQQEPGIALWANKVVARTDIPQRTDIDAPRNYRQNKHVLFGQQEGQCAGCRMDFPFKIFEVDHVIPRSKGGTDHLDNLQLLCPHCNRVKGDRSQEHLLAQLG